MSSRLHQQPVLVVGAGIMGAGIAQIASQAGHPVLLFDARDGAATQAKQRLAQTFAGLVEKGKRTQADADATLARIMPITTLAEASAVALVIEAIVENLEAKRNLFKSVEAVVSPSCIFATNTSSISVTALANGMLHPTRLVGMHFFNPVALMKLVEVISGLHTDPVIAEEIFALSRSWGKTPVHARSTPGFIVNRIARPYYAEALALLLERHATPEVIDAAMRGAGFRMGPCELMDLIGHDTNFAVTQSVYEANFFDKRFVPSLVQKEMVDGGLLGRKSERGFYWYPKGAPSVAPYAGSAPLPGATIEIHGTGAWVDFLTQTLAKVPTAQLSTLQTRPQSTWQGLVINGATLMQTDGRCANEIAQAGRDVAVVDRVFRIPNADEPSPVLSYAVAHGASEQWASAVPTWIAALGFNPQRVGDTPGLIVARTIAMLINEAADAVQQGVCSEEGANEAMKLGVNYPAGPFEWLSQWSVTEVVALLDTLNTYHRGERYRASPHLRKSV